jgi:hypothetical protein
MVEYRVRSAAADGSAPTLSEPFQNRHGAEALAATLRHKPDVVSVEVLVSSATPTSWPRYST